MTSLTSSAPWYFDLIELFGPWGAYLYHVIKVARIVSTQKANRAADLLFLLRGISRWKHHGKGRPQKFALF